MRLRFVWKASPVFLLAAVLFVTSAGQALAQGQGGGQGGGKKDKEQKKLDKEARKLAEKAEQAAQGLGRDVVFCILAAHTTGVGTAQELRAKYTALGDFPFGQFVAAALMADRLDKPLDDILTRLQAGKSLGQIAKEFDVNMGELRRGFGEFRSELARSMTNPPTRNCFETGS